MAQYYVQNVERGMVGNCLQWWKKDNHGYTTDLREAKVFDGDSQELKSLIRSDKKYRAWEKGYMDRAAAPHVDHQKVNVDLGFIGEPPPEVKEPEDKGGGLNTSNCPFG